MKPSSPFGRLLSSLTPAAALCLTRIQELPAYRSVACSLRPAIKIVEADEEDLRQAWAWLKPGSRRQPTKRSLGITSFVTRNGRQVVGLVRLVRRPPTHKLYAGHWLFSLAVRTRYRRMGIGQELSQTVVERAREEGARELLLRVDEDNRAGVRLYRKLGFQMVTIPALEAQLEREWRETGRRSVVLCLSLIEEGQGTHTAWNGSRQD
jgi:GNAT superfamily N-acetyltransferase